MFDREIYFDTVRESMFGGAMDQGQVNGQNALLTVWEHFPASDDMRWFAYMLATTFHETAATMLPIEEYGKGEGHDYGETDAETGQAYYGRGFVQLTWRENYHRATVQLGLEAGNDIEWHADRALNPIIAARVMFAGMSKGWFTGKCLDDYFNAIDDDAVGARKIINPDDKGPLIAGYHDAFLDALLGAWIATPSPSPVRLTLSANQRVRIHLGPNVEVV